MKSKKMRVYELAKELGISSKELIARLEKKGFSVSSHMAVLDDKALKLLKQEQKKKTSSKESKKEQIETMQQSQVNEKQKKLSARKQSRPSKKKNYSANAKNSVKKEEVVQVQEEPLKKLSIKEMTPDMFAQAIKTPVTQVILTLLRWGIVAPKNQTLDIKTVARLFEHYEIEEAEKTVESVQKVGEQEEQKGVSKEKLEHRHPIVVVMGHVDHGKTTFLDYIMKTSVAAKEKGGITQHLGVHEVGNIIFLDTPGHEAFIKIRSRGAKVADIAVLIVAADDSIMPQTVEAIKHAKKMEVPIIVAINKIDKVEQHQIEAVKRDLSQHDLLPEEWGGDIICVPISAKTGEGIPDLLEMISLQAEMLQLEADKTVKARGFVLEAKIKKGLGPVATLICQHGTIRKGDYFLCGSTRGRVSSLLDAYGSSIDEAGPSMPVRISGFLELPEAGDFLRVVSQREFKKSKGSSPEPISSLNVVSDEKRLNLIVKADTKSSCEALVDSIAKLSKKLEKGFNIIHVAVGEVNESDVALAENTDSQIVGFHVKIESNASVLARRSSVSIKLYGIIYKLIEDLEAYSESKKEVKKVKTKIGEAVVLKVFDIKKLGVIAGCAVKEGRCSREGTLVVWRGNTKVDEVKIKSLQRDKKTVKEVHAGFECGFLAEGFNDWAVDDRIECFLELPEGKTKK